jgi:hypothetical protein
VRFIKHDSDAIVLVMHDVCPPPALSGFSVRKTHFDLNQPSEKCAIARHDDEGAATAQVTNSAAYQFPTGRAQCCGQGCRDALTASMLHDLSLTHLLLRRDASTLSFRSQLSKFPYAQGGLQPRRAAIAFMKPSTAVLY